MLFGIKLKKYDKEIIVIKLFNSVFNLKIKNEVRYSIKFIDH